MERLVQSADRAALSRERQTTRFPYHAYAAQQDSGTIVVPNRSDYGEITYRDWFSAGGFESGYIAPDPFESESGVFDRLVRHSDAARSHHTGQLATVFRAARELSHGVETPIIYAPHDPHTMYYGAQYLLKTSDGAVNWKVISPDLTSSALHPAEVKKAAGGGHERIQRRKNSTIRMVKTAMIKTLHSLLATARFNSIAPSPVEAGMIWVGTSNGLVQLFRAGSWRDVTPADLPKGSDVN